MQAAIKGIKEEIVKKNEGGDPSLYPIDWPRDNGFPVKVLKAVVMREPTHELKSNIDIKSKEDLTKSKLKIYCKCYLLKTK